ncbi:MAG: NTP transferase domain-containing protein [Sphingomonadales bacterium]
MGKKPFILGVILAGGQGMRMGGLNKGEVKLSGYPLVEWAFMGLSPQVGQVVVNASSAIGLEVPFAADKTPDIKGPLAGVLAALAWGRENLKKPFAIVTVAIDTPFFPNNLVTKLSKTGAPALAAVGGEAQTTFGYWPAEIEEVLKAYTAEAPNPSIRGFAKQTDVALVKFKRANQFFNINTPEDLAKAEGMAGQLL